MSKMDLGGLGPSDVESEKITKQTVPKVCRDVG